MPNAGNFVLFRHKLIFSRQFLLLFNPIMTSNALKKAINSLPTKVNLSQTERATKYVEEASRIRLQDLKDNPGARVQICF
jgi:hypothetical protein